MWLLLWLGPLLILQRSLHRELQGIFLLLSRKPVLTIGLYSLIFFPGVLLHEGSHYIMARLLGVRTGKVSLIPRPIKGGTKLQLGFVETVPSDVVRDALIGAAPLITGGVVVAYIGIVKLGLISLWGFPFQGDSPSFLQAIARLPMQPDFWIWFYLAFVISSTMLPSPSDRQAWLPLGAILAILLALALIAGAGPWMADHIEVPMSQALRSVAGIFAISLAIHIVCWLPIALLRQGISRLTGLSIC